MVCLWSAGLSGSAFCILKLTGLLRISEDVEDTGMDSHHHSPPKAGGVRELGSWCLGSPRPFLGGGECTGMAGLCHRRPSWCWLASRLKQAPGSPCRLCRGTVSGFSDVTNPKSHGASRRSWHVPKFHQTLSFQPWSHCGFHHISPLGLVFKFQFFRNFLELDDPDPHCGSASFLIYPSFGCWTMAYPPESFFRQKLHPGIQVFSSLAAHEIQSYWRVRQRKIVAHLLA